MSAAADLPAPFRATRRGDRPLKQQQQLSQIRPTAPLSTLSCAVVADEPVASGANVSDMSSCNPQEANPCSCRDFASPSPSPSSSPPSSLLLLPGQCPSHRSDRGRSDSGDPSRSRCKIYVADSDDGDEGALSCSPPSAAGLDASHPRRTAVTSSLRLSGPVAADKGALHGSRSTFTSDVPMSLTRGAGSDRSAKVHSQVHPARLPPPASSGSEFPLLSAPDSGESVSKILLHVMTGPGRSLCPVSGPGGGDDGEAHGYGHDRGSAGESSQSLRLEASDSSRFGSSMLSGEPLRPASPHENSPRAERAPSSCFLSSFAAAVCEQLKQSHAGEGATLLVAEERVLSVVAESIVSDAGCESESDSQFLWSLLAPADCSDSEKVGVDARRAAERRQQAQEACVFFDTACFVESEDERDDRRADTQVRRAGHAMGRALGRRREDFRLTFTPTPVAVSQDAAADDEVSGRVDHSLSELAEAAIVPDSQPLNVQPPMSPLGGTGACLPCSSEFLASSADVLGVGSVDIELGAGNGAVEGAGRPRCALCHRTQAEIRSQGLESLGRLFGPYWLSASPVRRSHPPRGCESFYVHCECATWCPEVYWTADGKSLVNVHKAVGRARQLRCTICGQTGAALGCYVESCPRSYHLTCVLVAVDEGHEEFGMNLEKFLISCPRHFTRFLKEVGDSTG